MVYLQLFAALLYQPTWNFYTTDVIFYGMMLVIALWGWFSSKPKEAPADSDAK